MVRQWYNRDGALIFVYYEQILMLARGLPGEIDFLMLGPLFMVLFAYH
jgi:hypothetical protein